VPLTKSQKQQRLVQLEKDMKAVTRDMKTFLRIIDKYGGSLVSVAINMEQKAVGIVQEARELEADLWPIN
jgi:hypothetical protein